MKQPSMRRQLTMRGKQSSNVLKHQPSKFNLSTFHSEDSKLGILSKAVDIWTNSCTAEDAAERVKFETQNRRVIVRQNSMNKLTDNYIETIQLLELNIDHWLNEDERMEVMENEFKSLHKVYAWL
jgi:hypothetical protein